MPKKIKRKKKVLPKAQQKTLDKMIETRKKDSIHLRTIIKDKMQWALAEKEKGIKAIENVKNQILKLEGIILFCKDILAPKKEKK